MYDATFKIILFGDPGVGKITLAQRFITNLFVSNYNYSLGVDFEVKSLHVDGKQVKLQIWVLQGQERFRFLLPTYIRGVRGAIFMYDITNKSSLAHMDDWLEVIKQDISAEDMFPIILVGGKADLAENREVPVKDAIKIAKSRGLDAFIECSAKTGENVEEAFIALTRLMLDHSESRQNAVETGEAHLSELGSLKGALNDINIDLEQKRNRFAWKTYPYNPKLPKSPDNLNDLLKKLLSAIPEVKAAALVSIEGLPILAALPREVDETKFAALTAALCSIAKNAITTMQNGDFHQLYITGSKGYLLIRQVSPDAILILSADKDIGFRPFFRVDPYPYIFNPPKPPDDAHEAGQIQVLRMKPPVESEVVRFCQYCGAPLDEGISVCPNCKKLN